MRAFLAQKFRLAIDKGNDDSISLCETINREYLLEIVAQINQFSPTKGIQIIDKLP
jgi:hypothetical protein